MSPDNENKDDVTENQPVNGEPAAPKGSLTGRVLSWPFRKAAQGAWWLAKSPFVLYKKGVVASWENAETYKGKAATAFGAAAVGAVLVGTYAGAGLYVGTYGVVAAGDYYWFGQSYSEGDRVGTIAKLSNKGKFPCNTVEGELAMPNLGAGGSSTFSFSVRRGFPEVIEQLQKAYDEGYPVSLHYNQSHWPTEWFDEEDEGWFLPGLTVGGFECIQKTDYNIIAVEPKPNANIPGAPKFPENR